MAGSGKKTRGRDVHYRRSTRVSEQEAFQYVLDWLNAPIDDPGRQRFRELLRNVRVTVSNWVEQIDEDDGLPVLAYVGSIPQYKRAQRKMISLLKRYRFIPLMYGRAGRIWYQWTPISGPDGRFKRRWPPTDGKCDDVQAVYQLMGLAFGRGADRIRECDCGKWFFARFSHQRFCSTKCREKAFRSSPEWKDYRRRKAREYYWLHKSGKVR